MFKSTGTLYYNKSDGYRLTIEVDHELASYYRSLIPKYMRPQPPRWPPHVTVVRPEKETPPNLLVWEKYQMDAIDFEYEPHVYTGKVYFWLNIWCKRLEDIRLELGLPVVSQYTLPPDCTFVKCFHCTIANLKTLDSNNR